MTKTYDSSKEYRQLIKDKNIQRHERYVRVLLSRIYKIEQRNFKGVGEGTVSLMDLSEAIRLAELTDRQRYIIRLIYIEDYDQFEIAIKMGTVQPNISRRLSSGIRKIARVYEEWERMEKGVSAQ